MTEFTQRTKKNIIFLAKLLSQDAPQHVPRCMA